MAAKKKLGKEVKFLNALLRGRTISRRAATGSKFKLGNPSATALRIENNGHFLRREYTTKRINNTNVTTVKYSIL